MNGLLLMDTVPKNNQDIAQCILRGVHEQLGEKGCGGFTRESFSGRSSVALTTRNYMARIFETELL